LLGQPARDVLVEHAGDERLVGYAFLQRLGLNIVQIARRQADVDAAILDGGSPG
jgi:hypothetical protein